MAPGCCWANSCHSSDQARMPSPRRRTSATIVLITHALDEAAMLADRVGAMSARPGRFIDVIETGWPRERDSTVVGEASFGEITGRLWERLRGESLKALGHPTMPMAAE